jgi:hypothetical protein
MNKIIDNQVKMEAVDLDALDIELKVVEKIKYTELKTGNFFIVRKFKDGLIKSNTYSK